jgi:hypothetical protein
MNETLYLGALAIDFGVDRKFHVEWYYSCQFFTIQIQRQYVMRSYFCPTERSRFHLDLLGILEAGTDVSVDGVGMDCHREDSASVCDFGLHVHTDSPDRSVSCL